MSPARIYSTRYEAVKAATEAWKLRNPEGYRAYRTAKKQRARLRDPQKEQARTLLQRAVRTGDIVRPTICEDCGRDYEKTLHGHHAYGYDNPLLVQWLCVSCHTEAHRIIPEPVSFIQVRDEYLTVFETIRNQLSEARGPHASGF